MTEESIYATTQRLFESIQADQPPLALSLALELLADFLVNIKRIADQHEPIASIANDQ